MKPLALITNDDGITSPGILAIAEALEPSYELLIVAPKNQQTNMGRGSLKGKDVGSIERYQLTVNGEQVEAYAISGSPSQAVSHAVIELADRKPDICLSGINYGENLGLAFTCSGTLGAAFEADSLDIPSIAFSRSIPFEDQRSSEFSLVDWSPIKSVVREIVSNVINNGYPEGVRLLNVNFPSEMTDITEQRITKQAYMNYGHYTQPVNRDFSEGFVLDWELNHNVKDADKDTDIYAVHFDKVISITPLASIMSVNVSNYYR